MVSMSAILSFLASPAPTSARAPVPKPDATCDAACLASSSPPGVSCRVCSAFCPALAKPSPMAPAIHGEVPARLTNSRATTPPPPISGNDSTTECRMVLGLLSAVPMVGKNPLVSASALFAVCCCGDRYSSRNAFASFGLNPASSASLPACPPVTMSASPTINSGTPIAPFTAEIPTSATRRMEDAGFSGLSSPMIVPPN